MLRVHGIVRRILLLGFGGASEPVECIGNLQYDRCLAHPGYTSTRAYDKFELAITELARLE